MSASIPPGALPSGTTVSLYPVTSTATLASKLPLGQSYVLGFAISWREPNGSSSAATAPISMTITDSGIVAGDTIYELTTSGFKAVGTASANGTVTITFTSDPIFAVVAVPRMTFATGALVVQGSRIPVALSCQVSVCRGTIDLAQTLVLKTKQGKRTVVRVETIVLGEASYALGAGKRQTVQLLVSAPGRQAFAHVSKHPLDATLSGTVTGGASTTRAAVIR